jgi:hypothetical protein
MTAQALSLFTCLRRQQPPSLGHLSRFSEPLLNEIKPSYEEMICPFATDVHCQLLQL